MNIQRGGVIITPAKVVLSVVMNHRENKSAVLRETTRPCAGK